jgi:hypothetical protein
MRVACISLAAMVLLAVACKSSKENQQTEKVRPSDSNQESTNAEELLPITVEIGFQPSGSDPFSLNSVTISGDTLILSVQHSGGCKEHSWYMYTSGVIIKTYPPKLELYPVHKKNSDMCKALIKRDLKFNLAPLKFPGNDKLLLQIEGFPEFITYTY